jgi:SAM-dependent methyltransferase
MQSNFHYPAEYYDEDTTYGIPDRGDISFYKKYAQQQGSPVLELACGTGRILIPIAQTGTECYGLDSDREMLAICERKVRALELNNTQLQVASMDDFHYDVKFSLIYIPFRSFQHLLTLEQQLRCLQLIRDHLKDDGLFVLDVFAPNIDRIASYSKKKEEWEKDFSRKNQKTESTITRYYRAEANLVDQVLGIVMKWEERNDSGVLVARKEGNFKLRYIFRFELEHLLYRAGFAPTIFGDFSEQPYNYSSGETVAVCRKR